MNSKKSYDAPAVLVLEFEPEGTVCQSVMMTIVLTEEEW